MPKGPVEDTIVRLERRGCFGTCPAYSVELMGAGTVIYDGRCNVLITGRHVAKIDKAEFQKLVDAIRKANFWSLDDRYIAPVTDNPTYILTVKVGRRSKTLIDYVGTAVGLPKAVVAIENRVDKVGRVERWTSGDRSTLTMLRVEGWNFHGKDAAWALAWSSTHGSEAMALQLLSLGAPVSGAAPAKGCYPHKIASPIETAAQSRRQKLLQAFAEAGALQQRGAADDALFGAVGSGSLTIVEQALKFHPNINSRRDRGNTPVLWVNQGPHPYLFDSKTKTEYPAIIYTLSKAGADLGAANDDGNTALHEVVESDEASALIRAGAPLESRNHDGETPVLANFDEDVTLLLIKAGAKTNVRYADGKTLYDKALARKWTRVLARLKEQHPNRQ